jgi:hypothetical protein
VLDAVEKHTQDFGDKGNPTPPPARAVAILTCMDAKLDPATPKAWSKMSSASTSIRW